MKTCHNRRLLAAVLGLSCLVFAQKAISSQVEQSSVVFEAVYFDRYSPSSALDIVNNIPGFTLKDADNGGRGLSSASGNLLINGKRISSKSAGIPDFLSRIPAAEVEKIILIRDQASGIDLKGEAVVVNLIRRSESNSGAWVIGVNTDERNSSLIPNGEISYAGSSAGLDFSTGLSVAEMQGLSRSKERVFGPEGKLLEVREESSGEEGQSYEFSFSAAGEFSGTSVGLNASYGNLDAVSSQESPGSTDEMLPITLLQGSMNIQKDQELALDMEKDISKGWRGKAIVLHRRTHSTGSDSLVAKSQTGESRVQASANSNSVSTETIGRLETNFTGIEGHLLEFSAEAASNLLRSDFSFKELEGDDLILQEVPGATTNVSEIRYEFRISDGFNVGKAFINAAIETELSTITQTGGFEEERSFTFWKPSISLNYALGDDAQIQARVFREIGQLEFLDFVSSVDFEEDDELELVLGNPMLVPEKTVTFDTTFEQQFGDISSISLTGFYDRISDVEDLILVSDEFEVPGNIGSGSRFGVRTNVTLPLDRLGLIAGRLDLSGSLQTSRVTDPLTKQGRRLSSEPTWSFEVSVRQDIEVLGLSWNVNFFAEAGPLEFGLDELVEVGDTYDIEVYVDKFFLDNFRLRSGIRRLLQNGQSTDRRVYEGVRDFTPLAFREIRDESAARQWYIELTRTF